MRRTAGRLKWCGLLFFLMCSCPQTRSEYIFIPNSSFEDDLDADGIPDDWTGWKPYLIQHRGSAPPVTRSGSAAVEICRSNLFQSFAALPNHYYAFRAHTRGDDGGEQSRIQILFERASGPAATMQGNREVTTSQYLPLIVCQLSPPDMVDAMFQLGVRFPEWVYYDDCSLLSERLANPSLDAGTEGDLSGWILVGDPQLGGDGIDDSSAVGVSSVDFVAQEAAVCTDYDYLWAFRLRGNTGGEQALLSVEWLGPQGETMRIDSATPAVGSDWALYSIQARAPRDKWSLRPAMLLRARVLTPSATEYVWLDHVFLDKFLLVSERVSPNGDGVYDEAEIRLRLNEDTYVEMVLKDAGGGTAAVVEPGSWYAAGPHQLAWQPPPAIPAATYELEVNLQDGVGGVRTLTRPLVIDREMVFEGFPPLEQDHFVRGVYAGGTPVGMSYPDFALRLLEEAPILEANTFNIGTHLDARPSLLDLAESVGADVVMVMQHDYGYVRLTVSERGLDPVGFRERAAPGVEAIKDSPALSGYYTMDEPTLELSPRVFIMNNLFRDLDSLHPPLNTLDDITLGEQKLDLIQPPVYLYDDYPGNLNAPLGDLGGFVSRIEQASQLAASRGIPFWAALQAFTMANRRFLTRAETFCRAHVCLANGANGIFYFVLGAVRQIVESPDQVTQYGLVDTQFIPAPIYEDVRDVFRMLAQSGNLFLELEPSSPVGSTSAPGYTTATRDSAGNAYVWLINTDCLEPRILGVDLDTPYATGYDVLANRPIVWGSAGHRFEAALPPGGAVLVRLGEPPPSPPIPSDDLVAALGADETYDRELEPTPGGGPEDRYVSMAYDGGLIYLHTWTTDLEVWDFASPVRQRVARVQLGVPGSRMRVSGHRLVLADPAYGFMLVDVSDPSNPRTEGSYLGWNGNAQNVDIVGDALFVAAHSYGVYILDASDPADIQIRSRVPTAGVAQDIRVRDGLAYVADGVAGLTVLDVSDPNSPTILSNLRIPGDDARQIILRDDSLVYVIGKPTVVAAVDVSDPENPVLLHTEHTFHTEKAWARGSALAVADRVAGIALLDISDPRAPSLRARARVEGFPIDVIYVGDWLFTINHEFRFHQYELRDPFETVSGFPIWLAH